MLQQRLSTFWNSLSHRDRIGLIVLFAVALLAPFWGGWDFRESVRKETLSGTYVYTYNPYPAYWLFYLYAIWPPTLGYIFWNLTNAVAFLYALRHWKADLFRFSISLAAFWNFFGGQYEGFFAAGFVLALQGNWLWGGLGVFLLTFKPQVGWPLLLFALARRREARLLILPGILYALSFLVYGFWIPEWIRHILHGYRYALIGSTNISWYPIGLVFLTLLFLYRDEIKIWLLANSLAMPYYPIYSLATYFTMRSLPIWFHLGLWAFYAVAFLFPSLPSIGFLIPLGLLGYEVIQLRHQKGYGNVPSAR